MIKEIKTENEILKLLFHLQTIYILREYTWLINEQAYKQ